MTQQIDAVVWDIGRVLVRWSIRALYEKLIADPALLDWFLVNVVTEQWHFQHDAGRPLAEMIAERSAQFPAEADLIAAYAPRWLETVPGPIDGTHALVAALADRGMPQFSITNFGSDTWAMFRPTFPVLDHFGDIVVSGDEKLVKPDPAIFALAARRFGHAPGAMLFIDDNLANIRAAAECGWQVHHFVEAEALARDLVARELLLDDYGKVTSP
ncbi:HAD family hydrolase [Novosphingobium lentum]|uniref:HAD family hydrolase n=1 Tax=Novosphingobium lentum TaxID=145287 RepID=UPI00082F2CAD|nr:HAD family phosphatase [Novosphingobium lentum]